ncbi:hypothetical protein [Glaciecola sp. 1036]|uniref:hypothetical protein n=1 Tax=Alteromonadaceae TaxID=72275 RepID=UPI003CFE8120
MLFARELSPVTYKLAKKIQTDVSEHADFYILSYREETNLNKYESEFKDCFYVVSRKDLSEHCSQYHNKYNDTAEWKIMPGNLDLAQIVFTSIVSGYSYYWFCEDDVRFTSNYGSLVTAYDAVEDDLLCTNLRKIPDRWFYKNTYLSNDSVVPDKIGFLPFFRVSSSAIDCLIDEYSKGAGGHHEISWPNLLARNNLSVKDLKTYVPNLYTSNKNRLSLGWGTFCYFPPKYFVVPGTKRLYHPVKPFAAYVTLYKKYLLRNLSKIFN